MVMLLNKSWLVSQDVNFSRILVEFGITLDIPIYSIVMRLGALKDC
jgi:hypothetical protein